VSTELLPAPEITPTISLLEADVLRELLGISAFPYPLDVPSQGATLADRKVLRGDALASLAARGLADGEHPVGDLADDLHVLGRPDLAVDCVYHPGGDAPIVRALVASRGRRAVAAVVTPDGLHLHPCRTTALAHEVVGVLPPGTAGTGLGMTVPADVLDAAAAAEAAGGPQAGLAHLTANGVSPTDATLLRAVFAGRRRGGQIGCVRTTDTVARTSVVRSPEMISWVDSTTGRYMTVTSVGSNPVVSLVPVDDARLLRRIGELVAGA
jgi:hypothetical protein